MAVTAYIDERNGAPAGVEQQNVSNINMGSNDSYQLVPATYPITAGTNAFEKWLKIRFTGVDNKVDNVQTWISAGTLDAQADMVTNARTSSYVEAETYAQPTASSSSVATQTMPEADPGAANLGIGGSLTGNLSADGSSDYLVLQYQTGATHAAGDIAQLTITFQWDEQ